MSREDKANIIADIIFQYEEAKGRIESSNREDYFEKHREMLAKIYDDNIGFKAQEQSDENVGSLVKRFGEVVAEKQKYKELYEQECTNHHYTRLSWDRTCEERDKLKASAMQQPTDEEIEAMAGKEYGNYETTSLQGRSNIGAFKKGFKAALNQK